MKYAFSTGRSQQIITGLIEIRANLHWTKCQRNATVLITPGRGRFSPSDTQPMTSLAFRVTPASAASSEHALVAATRRGDDRAFEELYARYRRRIGSYINGMVGDHGRAEDISQEVFISALRRIRDTERPIAFKPWIYEIAKNACIDHFRRRRAEEVPLDGDDALQATDRGKLVLAATPEAAVESKA